MQYAALRKRAMLAGRSDADFDQSTERNALCFWQQAGGRSQVLATCGSTLWAIRRRTLYFRLLIWQQLLSRAWRAACWHLHRDLST
jgi:hypothetical protein